MPPKRSPSKPKAIIVGEGKPDHYINVVRLYGDAARAEVNALMENVTDAGGRIITVHEWQVVGFSFRMPAGRELPLQADRMRLGAMMHFAEFGELDEKEGNHARSRKRKLETVHDTVPLHEGQHQAVGGASPVGNQAGGGGAGGGD